MFEEDKGSSKYMLIVWGINQQVNCYCLIETPLLEEKGKSPLHVERKRR